MPKAKKKDLLPDEAEDLPHRFKKLEREVKILRALLKEQLEKSLESFPERQDVLVGMVGAQWVAMSLACIVEVLPRVLLTPLPEVPPYVSGCMQWRGAQVPVIDLSARWGDPPLPVKLEDRIIILEYRKQIWGLLLSHVDHLSSISRQQIDPIPAEIPSAPFALGLWSYGDHSVLLLSIDHLINPVELAAS